MANPFGGSGEALVVNTSHANYAALKAAVVPRSTTVIKEAVADVNLTQEGGTANIATYDANGFIWTAGGSSLWYVNLGASIDLGGNVTIIIGIKSTGADKTGSYPKATLWNQSYKEVAVFIEGWGETLFGTCTSDAGTAGSSADNLTVNSTFFYGVASCTDGTNNVQKWRYLGSNACPPSGTIQTPTMANSALNPETAGLNQIRFGPAKGWGLQYLFAYNAYLSDADIAAIIQNPAGVVAPAGASYPSLSAPTVINIGQQRATPRVTITVP